MGSMTAIEFDRNVATEGYTPTGSDIYDRCVPVHLGSNLDQINGMMKMIGVPKHSDPDIHFDESPNNVKSVNALDSIDSVDYKILMCYAKAMQEKTKISLQYVANILNMSKPSVFERLEKIKKRLPKDKLQLLGIF